MLGILKVDHIGIRIADKNVSVAFYQNLGFKLLADAGYDHGHPINWPAGKNLSPPLSFSPAK